MLCFGDPIVIVLSAEGFFSWRSEAAEEKDCWEYLITKNLRKEHFYELESKQKEYYNQLKKESSQESGFVLVVGLRGPPNFVLGMIPNQDPTLR